MDIQAIKIELVKAILAVDNVDFIKKVSDFVKQEKGDFWNQLSISQQQEIEQGIEELNAGKKISFDSVLSKIS